MIRHSLFHIHLENKLGGRVRTDTKQSANDCGRVAWRRGAGAGFIVASTGRCRRRGEERLKE